MLLLQLLSLERGQPPQLHFENRLRLQFAELEVGNQILARRVHSLAAADGGDDFVEHVERAQQPFHNVQPLLGALEVKGRTAADDLLPVVDEVLEHALEVERFGLPIHQRQELHAKGLLQRRELVEVAQHNFGVHIAFELDDDAHARAVALVAQVADALELAVAYKVGNALEQRDLVGLVGQFGDEDPHAPARQLLEVRLGLHDQPRPPCRVALVDDIHRFVAYTLSAVAVGAGVARRRSVALLVIAEAVDDAPRGEVRPLDELHEVGGVHFVEVVEVIDHVGGGVHDLAQVVGRDIGGHAHGNAAGAVDEQIGQRRRQHHGFAQRVVEIGPPLDGFLVQVLEHEVGNGGEARFGVAHGGGVVAVHRAEVALAVNQRVAQREGLRHAHHGVINRRIAMGVILAQHLTDDARALLVGLVVGQPQVVPNGVEDAPVHRLEAVAHVGQGARHNHAHGVIEVRLLHLANDVGRAHKACVGCHDGAVAGGAVRFFAVLLLIAHWNPLRYVRFVAAAYDCFRNRPAFFVGAAEG